MNILITQREDLLGHAKFLHSALESSWYYWLTPLGHKLLPAPNILEFHPYYDDWDCLILTGGPDSINRNRVENVLFAETVKRGKPVIGICHGAQAINDLTRGKFDYIDGHHDVDHEVVYVETGERVVVNSFHRQSIKELGPKMVPVCVDNEGYIEAFKHDELPIYGMIWHPERMNNHYVIPEVAKILNP